MISNHFFDILYKSVQLQWTVRSAVCVVSHTAAEKQLDRCWNIDFVAAPAFISNSLKVPVLRPVPP